MGVGGGGSNRSPNTGDTIQWGSIQRPYPRPPHTTPSPNVQWGSIQPPPHTASHPHHCDQTRAPHSLLSQIDDGYAIQEYCLDFGMILYYSIPVGAIWLTVKRFKKQKRQKQSKTFRFPRADDIEKERSKNFQKLQVDMTKVHLVCNDEDWDEIYPHVSSKSNASCDFVL